MSAGARLCALAVLLPATVLPAETARAAAPPPVSQAPWLRIPRGPEANLAPAGEPGGRFDMEGRVLGANGKPLAGLTLYVYHADAQGRYASDPNAYPRLAGVLRTDAQGRYRVTSVLPGMYEGPPHVHFEGWSRDLEARAWFVNLLMGPGEKPDSAWGRMAQVRRSMLEPSRPETFVTRDANGVFHAHYALRWERGMELPAAFDSLRRGRGGARRR